MFFSSTFIWLLKFDTMKMKCVEADKRKHFIGTIPFVGTVQFVCGIIHKDI